jgi:hypothetical protein
MTIDGSMLSNDIVNYSNVLYHTGNGTLTIQNLALTGGHESHKMIDGLGGCVYSKGSVTLENSNVASCSVYSEYVTAKGGGIYAKGNVSLTDSTVSGNTATGSAQGYGGGIWAGGEITLSNSFVTGNDATAFGNALGGGMLGNGKIGVYFSTVNLNSATSNGAALAAGGGIQANADLTLWHSQLKYNSLTSGATAQGAGAFADGVFYASYSSIEYNSSIGTSALGSGLHLSDSATLANTTVSGNSTTGSYAAIDAFTVSPAGKTLLMRNSTVSSNTADTKVGGLYSNFGETKFYNSTIAFNTAVDGSSSPGVVVSGSFGANAVTLQSTILSNNTYGSNELDLSVTAPMSVTFNPGPAPNLVRATLANNLPSGTIFGLCPLLGPLRNNGGLTKTHALLSTSAAIDAGSNVLVDPNTMLPYAYDQRGSADSNGGFVDYLRVSGPTGQMNPQADIGAYEVQQDDIVFNAGFDGCPVLF